MDADGSADEALPSCVLVKVEPLESDDSDGDRARDNYLPPPPAGSLPPCLEEEPLVLDTRDAVPHPGAELLRCLHCHRDLPPAHLQRHMTTEHGYRRVRFKCQVCLQTFPERSELAVHRTSQHARPVELVTCDICYQQFGKKYLQKHIANVHCPSDVVHRCPACGKMFKSRETLKDHLGSVHRTADPVQCRLCAQEFRSKKYLVNHIRNVHPKGDKIFKCKACSKVFKSRMCLHQHLKNVHPPESASAPCAVCPKVFKTKANLAQHMKHCHPAAAAVAAAAAAASRRSRVPSLAELLEAPAPLVDSADAFQELSAAEAFGAESFERGYLSEFGAMLHAGGERAAT